MPKRNMSYKTKSTSCHEPYRPSYIKETRMQEIKRCLDRALELGGSTPEAYDLTVDDFNYLYDKLEKINEYIENTVESEINIKVITNLIGIEDV